jgi:hypothetical protein
VTKVGLEVKHGLFGLPGVPATRKSCHSDRRIRPSAGNR